MHIKDLKIHIPLLSPPNIGEKRNLSNRINNTAKL